MSGGTFFGSVFSLLFFVSNLTSAALPSHFHRAFTAELMGGMSVSGIAEMPTTAVGPIKILHYGVEKSTGINSIAQALYFPSGHLKRATAVFLMADPKGKYIQFMKFHPMTGVFETYERLPDPVYLIEKRDSDSFAIVASNNDMKLVFNPGCNSVTSASKLVSSGYFSVITDTDVKTMGQITRMKWIDPDFYAVTTNTGILAIVHLDAAKKSIVSDWKVKIAGPTQPFWVVNKMFATSDYILLCGLDQNMDPLCKVYSTSYGSELFTVNKTFADHEGTVFFDLPGDQGEVYATSRLAIEGVDPLTSARFSQALPSLMAEVNQLPIAAQQGVGILGHTDVSINRMDWQSMYGKNSKQEPSFSGLASLMGGSSAAFSISPATVNGFTYGASAPNTIPLSTFTGMGSVAPPATRSAAGAKGSTSTASSARRLFSWPAVSRPQFRTVDDVNTEKRKFQEYVEAALNSYNFDAGRTSPGSIMQEKRPLVLIPGKTTLGDLLVTVRMLWKYGLYKFLQIMSQETLESFGLSISFKYQTVGPADGHSLDEIFELERFYASVESLRCERKSEQ